MLKVVVESGWLRMLPFEGINCHCWALSYCGFMVLTLPCLLSEKTEYLLVKYLY